MRRGARWTRSSADSSPSQKELIPILHAVQAEYGYVPADAVAAISRFLSISEGEIYGVLTFYRGFGLEPRGKFLITVCLGTACHVRGGAEHRRASSSAGSASRPAGRPRTGEFTLETVNCLGCCAIGPGGRRQRRSIIPG